MTGSPLGVVALVTHARTVPSEAREQFGEAAAVLRDDPRVMRIRTCHRVELYAVREMAGAGVPLELPHLPEGGQRLEDHEAVRHLFAVAAGLDSIVVGEDQILHQLRDCLSERHLAGFDQAGVAGQPGRHETMPEAAPGALQPTLDRLFQIALHVGRRSRAWREGPLRSLADVALDRLASEVGSLRGREVLIVGAGRMSRLTALTAARREAHVIVTNRSVDRAAALAADVDGSSVPFGQVGPADIAGVVVALAGPWALLPGSARSLIGSGVPVVDLSSPPALSPDLRNALGQQFVSVDDIARGPEEVVRDRIGRRIERLIDEADTEFSHWVGGRGAVPAIRALTEHAEARRVEEVDRLLRRMPHIGEHDRDLVDQMSRRLVAGLLHSPLATLREDESGEHERAARDLFAL